MLKLFSNSLYNFATTKFQSLFIGCTQGPTNLCKPCRCSLRIFCNVHIVVRPVCHVASSMPPSKCIRLARVLSVKAIHRDGSYLPRENMPGQFSLGLGRRHWT